MEFGILTNKGWYPVLRTEVDDNDHLMGMEIFGSEPTQEPQEPRHAEQENSDRPEA